MSYKIEPIEDDDIEYPYTVKVNGVILMGKYGERRFKDSFEAAIAGQKEVDRLRAEATVDAQR